MRELVSTCSTSRCLHHAEVSPARAPQAAGSERPHHPRLPMQTECLNACIAYSRYHYTKHSWLARQHTQLGVCTNYAPAVAELVLLTAVAKRKKHRLEHS
jgi:hypothetical protein